MYQNSANSETNTKTEIATEKEKIPNFYIIKLYKNSLNNFFS